MISTKQSILNTLIGTLISIFNAIIQFLLIYFILDSFGTEFNGFVRVISSFNALIATAESALGVATITLLIRALSKNDWITANEVYSCSKKNYKKSASIMGSIIILISLFYPLFVSVNGIEGIFDAISWKNLGMNLTGTNSENSISYWGLFLITIIFGFKNFIVSFFFSVYENLIMANNKKAFTKIVILFTDITVYTLLLLLLSFTSINPILIFLPLLLYSPLRGLMCYFYAKKYYIWLKYQKNAKSYNLHSIANKISYSNLGSTILLNTDIFILALVFGLNVSSNISLYMVIAVNTRLIMTNFITSFREYFVTIIEEKGRIYYKSYNKYELYSYLIAAFTFINMAILSPYFVSSLYGQSALNSMENSLTIDNATVKSFEFIFFSFKFSILYAASVALAILCESQLTLIQAKTNGGQIAKTQNILGGIYLVFALGITFIFQTLKIGNENYLVNGLIAMYSWKISIFLIRYIYLWMFVYKYVTYNSTFKYSWRNFAILIIFLITTILFINFYLSNTYEVEKMTLIQNKIEPLVVIFFASIFASIFSLTLISLIMNYEIMLGIFKSFPFIKRLLFIKSNENRKKRLSNEGISSLDIVDNSNLLSEAMDTITISLDKNKNDS